MKYYATVIMNELNGHVSVWDGDSLCVKFKRTTILLHIVYGYKWNKHVKLRKKGCISVSVYLDTSGKGERGMV